MNEVLVLTIHVHNNMLVIYGTGLLSPMPLLTRHYVSMLLLYWIFLKGRAIYQSQGCDELSCFSKTTSHDVLA